ncbi:type II toxin-antitoxin system YoeB family toxin [Elizabethkingia anophelis]|uniref:type II toxin-antitoxin system YoeB family toxin n=1 Tax=Elizabethkingia anophelis TaxID=1117645 RepID=UPI0020139944|nr:type II toxin-antitoxin system YoeB family toxin [Elizabethkingia anophelis]EJC8060251.1 type II toxin-antitoxin system YoeB family toxin [Elizabethkingia anophelis]MCL1643068.1 type II toxin-antitoxin system YoeB family toxin [Elizabethkingia anophelis]MCL1643749.1 type II toxin-antitoxin system YoeB family toxin [Elizabethkingia anophelis]MCT4032850.1 type II toxin-antitoxin system YoeB family toxin [Elizabethkingia anophelis]MDV3781448.1 hypothetical protein [Elizabethkingia anophelis]
MQLVLNELSFYPLASQEQNINERFQQLLLTFKESKHKYGFKHIRFPNNYIDLPISESQNFIEWITSTQQRKLRDLLLGLCKKPFIDDLEENEIEKFLESEYKLPQDRCPTQVPPIGIPVSYIKQLPTISLDSHIFWRNRKIYVEKNDVNSVKKEISIYNICLDTDVHTLEINEWAKSYLPKSIKTKESLSKFLEYSKYKIEFTDIFIVQLLNWKEENFDTFEYILDLMKDVENHPFTGGIGQTENLKNRGKEASKRINNSYPSGDRLSYTLSDNVVKFIACKGHYEFH